jgi:hypothetical protein
MNFLLPSFFLHKRKPFPVLYYSPAMLKTSLLLTGILSLCGPRLTAAPVYADKIITVKVNSSGMITVGRDTIGSDDLALYIRERLFKSYTGTGKMYDGIRFVIEGNPQAAVTEVVLKEIANGQKKALIELCIEKYKRVFEDISTRQQGKIRKNFPVLFQTNYD